MKKLFCVLLVFVLLFSASLAEETETDPIVGIWYANLELNGEITIPGYEDYTRFLVVLSFEPTGEIVRFEVDYKGKETEASAPFVVGKWKKTEDGDYSLSVVALGTEKAYIEDGILYAMAVAKDMYYCFHKMISFDWYNDMFLI